MKAESLGREQTCLKIFTPPPTLGCFYLNHCTSPSLVKLLVKSSAHNLSLSLLSDSQQQSSIDKLIAKSI